MKKNKEDLLAELINVIFDDNEGNIEHVEMDYGKFIMKLRKLAD